MAVMENPVTQTEFKDAIALIIDELREFRDEVRTELKEFRTEVGIKFLKIENDISQLRAEVRAESKRESDPS